MNLGALYFELHHVVQVVMTGAGAILPIAVWWFDRH
jgi:hypothetical protein